MITAVDLTRAPEGARAYIAADLGHHALHDAEIVLLDAWPPDERALSDLQLH
jgi:hypothetical protein